MGISQQPLGPLWAWVNHTKDKRQARSVHRRRKLGSSWLNLFWVYWIVLNVISSSGRSGLKMKTSNQLIQIQPSQMKSRGGVDLFDNKFFGVSGAHSFRCLSKTWLAPSPHKNGDPKFCQIHEWSLSNMKKATLGIWKQLEAQLHIAYACHLVTRSNMEATGMDPMQRHILETSYEDRDLKMRLQHNSFTACIL